MLFHPEVMDLAAMADKIRKVPDWPKEGILFHDITPVLQSPEYFRLLVDLLVYRYMGQEIDVVAGLDARGFIIGAALAYLLDPLADWFEARGLSRALGVAIISVQGATRHRQFGGRQHAEPHRFSVTVATVPRDGFEGVPCRVPEVQNPPLPVFVFVGHHHVGLDATTGRDHFSQRRRLSREQGIQVTRNPVKQRS